MKIGYVLLVEVPAETDLPALKQALAAVLPDGAVLSQQWVLVSEEERLAELARSEET